MGVTFASVQVVGLFMVFGYYSVQFSSTFFKYSQKREEVNAKGVVVAVDNNDDDECFKRVW